MGDGLDLSLLDSEFGSLLAGSGEMTFTDELVAILQATPGVEPVVPSRVERRDLRAGSVTVTVLRPRGATGALPCLVWLHGGGFVIGDRFLELDDLVDIVGLGFACATVEYRLAPATRYPGALDDSEAGLRSVHAHAAALGIDPGRIGVGGRSAGGNLAAALALRLRADDVVRPAFQYLEYPKLDDRQETPSSGRPGLAMWNRESSAYSWQAYLAGLETVPADAAPARAESLAGLPPTFISVGTADGFRDEDIAYAQRLMSAGVETELHVYAGAPHGFHLFTTTQVVARAKQDSLGWLAQRGGVTA
jgi:acetyl esterase/lipase